MRPLLLSALAVAYAAIGAAATYATLQPLTPVAWGIYAGGAVVAYGLYLLSRQRRPEVLWLFAGPGVLMVVVGITGDHTLAVSPLPFGILIIAATAAVYAMRLQFGPSRP